MRRRCVRMTRSQPEEVSNHDAHMVRSKPLRLNTRHLGLFTVHSSLITQPRLWPATVGKVKPMQYADALPQIVCQKPCQPALPKHLCDYYKLWCYYTFPLHPLYCQQSQQSGISFIFKFFLTNSTTMWPINPSIFLVHLLILWHLNIFTLSVVVCWCVPPGILLLSQRVAYIVDVTLFHSIYRRRDFI